MKYGLSDKQLDEIIKLISTYQEIEEAVLFGSRAIDTYKEASDVDIALKGENVTASLAAKLKYAFEEDTYLPFFFDFVAYPKINNDELKKHIDTKGISIYKASRENCTLHANGSLHMSDWKECKLVDIADIYDERRIPLSKMEREEKKGVYPYYGASGIIDYINDFIFDGEYVLVSEDGENLKTRKTPVAFKASGKFWVNNHAHILRGKCPHLNDILIYYIQNLDLNPYLTGAVQPKLNQENLNSITFFLPVLESEQKAIAGVLSSLDDKIDLLHRQNKTLEAMAETLFRQYFIEEADAGWAEGKILDYCTHHKDGINPQDFPTLIFSHFSIPAFDNNMNPLTESGSEIQSNKYSVVSNCILFSKLNPNKDKRIWLILDQPSKNSVCSTEFQVVLPKDKKYLFFIYSWLSIPQNYNEIASGVGGTSGSHQRIAPSDIFNSPCPIIGDYLIEQFNGNIESIFVSMQKNRIQIHTLEKLRDALLPKLMSGEIRVK